MIRNVLYFALLLLLLLALAAGFHMAYLYANQISVPIPTLVFCYLVNFGLALLIYIAILKMADEKSKYLGFVFLMGSAFKFAAYFLIFDPLFKQDGNLSKVEFFLFFVPYLVSLFAETLALVKLLKRM